MKLYVAGPMAGYLDFNKPRFARVAQELRAQGHEVVSPVEVCADLPDGLPGTAYLARDIAALTTCDGIALIEGWDRSIGATAEAAVALACGLAFHDESGEPTKAPAALYVRPYRKDAPTPLPPHEPDYGRLGNPAKWCERCRLDAQATTPRQTEQERDQ